MNNAVYYIPVISWVNRLYHIIKRDEDKWDFIYRNMMCATGNIIGAAFNILICAIIIFIKALSL